MARKRRTKAPAKRSSRKKSDSDQNSNGMSDENEVDSKQEFNSEEQSSKQDSNSEDYAEKEEYHYNSYGEKNHKHPKFRYLERRHSSSQDEDSEYNTSDLMPQQIHDIVLGDMDMRAVIISQDDIANDTCFQGDIEHEEVIVDTMECESSEIDVGVNIEQTNNLVTRTEGEPAPSVCKVAFVESSDLIKSFEKTVQINENVNKESNLPNEVEDEPSKPSANLTVNETLTSSERTLEDVAEPSKSEVKPESPPPPPPPPPPKDIQEEESKKVEEDKKKPGEPRRRSNRIRSGTRWGDEEVKVPVTQEAPISLPPPPPSLFDSDKPVKVKSRWRRTSELEMGGTSGSSMTSDSEVSSITTVSLTSPEVPTSDPDVEEGIKSFEHITQNVFRTPRIKKERLVCECSLTKEEIAKGEMGCGDDCLNRLLMIECGSRCVLGNLCSNRQFQDCQYTPCQVVKTKNKGLGLITTVSVPSGTFIMEYVGEVLESKEFRRRAKEYAKEKNAHYYFMQLEASHVIDATSKGNISRFINHSCDPNAETQKWTVNGELRIGFFSKKPIAAGEEITFDYKLDRYGKEAQKCFCGSSNCRGWIGENPENEKEREKKDGKKERREKKRREEKRSFLTDRELEDAVEKLVSTGVKNQKHTLTLCRLMVRAEDDHSRIQLLSVLRTADLRCLRLFLDYHGLSLLWSYMVGSNSSPELRIEILKTLAALPIFNKSTVQDSKVFGVLQKWAKVDVPTSKDGSQDSEGTGDDSKSPPMDTNEKKKELTEKDEESERKITQKAKDVLNTWLNLKQEFRIPKKERIEQMKEHEREADRGYCDPRDNQSYDRHWNFEKDNRSYEKENRYGNTNNTHRERKRGRESPSETDWRKSRMQDERSNGSVNRLSKMERRQLFAMKVEEEERQRKMEEDWAKQQQMLGPPQQGPPQMDPNQGYYQQPPFHPPSVSSWSHPYGLSCEGSRFDGGEMVFGGCPPAYPPPFMGPPQQPPPPYMDGPPPFSNPPPSGPPPGGFHPPPYSHPSMAPPYQPPLPTYPPFPYNPPPPQAYPTNPAIPAPTIPAPNLPPPNLPAPNLPAPAVALSTPPPAVPIPNGPPPVLPLATATPATVSITATAPAAIALAAGPPPPPPPLPQVFPIKLPPKWRSAKDKEGRIYYYHTKTRKSQWQIPTEENIHVSESESDSEDSSEEEESSTEEEEDEKEEEEFEDVPFEEEDIAKNDGEEEYVPEELKFDNISPPNPTPTPPVPSNPPVLKKRREGLVQVNIISPRDEDDDYRCGIKKKEIRETKARLAREKKKLLRSGGAAKCEADTSGGPKRRIKDLFRIQMADVIVSVLNPYRKSDCKIGRITTTEDFKHLARKLTHFVMVKELKHCSSVDELECNENVKHKARDFVRKYMSKFGPFYKRSPDD